MKLVDGEEAVKRVKAGYVNERDDFDRGLNCGLRYAVDELTQLMREFNKDRLPWEEGREYD